MANLHNNIIITNRRKLKMKLTNKQLKQIIKEELEAVLQESTAFPKDLTSINIGPGRRTPARNEAVTAAMNAFRAAETSTDDNERKYMFINTFRKLISTYGLNFEEAIEIMEAAGREVGYPRVREIIRLLRSQGSSDSNVVIDDPMMQ
tara:strand:+ start:153 stop:596 length:444 start_codon:yes stop_codon:yes gene_type:complete